MIGSVVTILAIQYGDVWKESNAKSVVGAIAFAGTVVGQLAFGYLYVPPSMEIMGTRVDRIQPFQIG